MRCRLSERVIARAVLARNYTYHEEDPKMNHSKIKLAWASFGPATFSRCTPAFDVVVASHDVVTKSMRKPSYDKAWAFSLLPRRRSRLVIGHWDIKKRDDDLMDISKWLPPTSKQQILSFLLRPPMTTKAYKIVEERVGCLTDWELVSESVFVLGRSQLGTDAFIFCLLLPSIACFADGSYAFAFSSTRKWLSHQMNP